MLGTTPTRKLFANGCFYYFAPMWCFFTPLCLFVSHKQLDKKRRVHRIVILLVLHCPKRQYCVRPIILLFQYIKTIFSLLHLVLSVDLICLTSPKLLDVGLYRINYLARLQIPNYCNGTDIYEHIIELFLLSLT